MGGQTGGASTSTTPYRRFLPAFQQLFQSAFADARTAAGQQPIQGEGYGTSGFGNIGLPPTASGGGAPGVAAGAPPPTTGGTATSQGGTGINARDEQQAIAGVPPIIGKPFQGPFVAQATPAEKSALAQKLAFGESLGGVGDSSINLGLDTAGGKYLYAGSNPYLQSAIGAAVAPAFDAYNAARGGVQSQAIQQGAYKGSSRRGLTEAQLATDLTRNVGDIASKIALQNYTAERANQLAAPTTIAQGINLGLQPFDIQSQAGLGQREAQQLAIQNAMQAFQEQSTAPWRPIMPLANIIQGSNVGTTTTGPGTSVAANTISGALGGAATGASIGSVWPGYGTAIGGILGALAGGAGGYFGN